MKIIWELLINGETEMCFKRKKDALAYVDIYKKKHNIKKLKNAKLVRWDSYPKCSFVYWEPKEEK